MFRHRTAGLAAVILAAGLLMGSAPAQAAADTTADANVIRVSGSATVTLAPDVAYITLSVVSSDKKLADARTDNNTRMDKVLALLGKQGVEDKDVQTTNYSIWPRYNDAGTAITGYELTNTVQVKVRNLDKLSAVLDGAVTAGANSVGGLSFGVDDREAAYNQALGKAIADARTRADTLAKAAGRELGTVKAMTESSAYQPYYDLKGTYALAAADTAATSLSAGTTQITATVNVDFTLR